MVGKSKGMKDLQDSLMEITSSSSKRQTGTIRTIPEVFQVFESHQTGKNAQARALVEALTSIIQENNGDTIPTAYFALILVSLPSSSAKDLEVLLFVLKKLLPEIPPSVLTNRFAEITKAFHTLVHQHYEIPAIVINVRNTYPISTSTFHWMIVSP
jgi:hypothetical protein